MNRVKIYIFVFSYENQGAEEGGLNLGGVGLGASPGRPPITFPTDAPPWEVMMGVMAIINVTVNPTSI